MDSIILANLHIFYTNTGFDLSILFCVILVVIPVLICLKPWLSWLKGQLIHEAKAKMKLDKPNGADRNTEVDVRYYCEVIGGKPTYFIYHNNQPSCIKPVAAFNVKR